jgi:hypothetical protein
MPWIGAKPQAKSSADAAARQPAAPASLELATVVRARGHGAANAIVEHASAHECRLRSVVMFDTGAVLEFDLELPGHAAVSVRGRVASTSRSGPRFVYRVAFESMTPRETDDLARSLAHSHRTRSRLRDAAALERIPVTTDGLTRKHLRFEATFPIQYRTPKEDYKAAKAANVSPGGMLMTCGDALVEGMLLELHVCLPSDVLDAYPEETVVLDLRQTTERRAVPSKLRRPFETMVLHARVAFHDPIGNGVYNYGLAFCGIEREEREELARYVDAVRHAERRSKTPL